MLINYYTGSTNLKLLDPSWFRKQMSAVSQEPTLFACSIRDNISYGKEADFNEVDAFRYFKILLVY